MKPLAVVAQLSATKSLQVLAAAVAILCGVDGARADTVRGDCRYKGVTYAFADAAVVKEPNTFDEKKIDTVVAFTTYPINKKALAAATEKTDAIAEQGYMIDEARRLELHIDEGKVATVNFNGAGSSVSQSGGDIGKLQTQVNDAKRVAGSFVLEGDDDDDVRCNVGFDLAYATTTAATPAGGSSATSAAAAAPTGKALPAGGGEPGKVFQANLAAMQKGDVDAMLATVTKEQADKIRAQRKEPQFGAMLAMMKSFAPKSATVTGGQDFGDTAELTIDAVDQSGGKSTGTSKLRKEGGAWKVEKTSMKGTL